MISLIQLSGARPSRTDLLAPLLVYLKHETYNNWNFRCRNHCQSWVLLLFLWKISSPINILGCIIQSYWLWFSFLINFLYVSECMIVLKWSQDFPGGGSHFMDESICLCWWYCSNMYKNAYCSSFNSNVPWRTPCPPLYILFIFDNEHV